MGISRLARIGANAMGTATRGPTLGYSAGQPFGNPAGFTAGTGDEELNRFNQWLRAQPWHQSFMDATQNRGRGDLTDAEGEQLTSLMKQHGVPVAPDMKIDQAGNVHGRAWADRHSGLLKDLALAGGVAGAAFGFPALFGALGGGAAGGAGAAAGLGPEIGLGGEGLAAGLGGAGAIGAGGAAAGLGPAIGLGGAGLAEGLGGAGEIAGMGGLGSAASGLSGLVEGPGNPGGYLDALGGASGGGLGSLLKRLAPALAGLGVAGIGAAKSGAFGGSNGPQLPPEMQDALKTAFARITNQNDVAQGINKQAYEGLPAYARRS